MFFTKKVKSQKSKVERKSKSHPLLTRNFRLGTRTGFTLVELMVTVGIFVFLTALIVANYGRFNDGTLLTSMAYDIALTLRDTQSYGMNVQGYSSSTGYSSNIFNYPYGMDFNSSNAYQTIVFADAYTAGGGSNSYYYGLYVPTSDPSVSTYTFARGGLIKCLFVSSTTPPSPNPCPFSDSSDIDISFKRPNPNAIIKSNGSTLTYPYAVIQVQDASKTTTRTIVVNETGEISVQNQ